MLTVTALLDQFCWLYQGAIPMPGSTWDFIVPVDGAYFAVKYVDGAAHVHWRGSNTAEDWLQDFTHFAIPTKDPDLGPVHPGGIDAVRAIMPMLLQLVGDRPCTFVGHSLGAIHAALAGGLLILGGGKLERIVLIGEPKSGGPQLSKIYADAGVVIESYRNGDANNHDLVTDVPFHLVAAGATPTPQAVIDFPYQHLKDPLLPCCYGPPPGDKWGLFSWHHGGLYARAFGCGAPQALALPI